MDDNEPIICFQHCEESVNIFCLELPVSCPVCSHHTQQSPFKVPPFRLPSPFVHSKEATQSVVLKPTDGSFLSDYTSSTNLHVGITDSRGAVYDFDETGVHRSLDGWNQVLAVDVIKPQWTYEYALWNTILLEHFSYDLWLPERYDLDENNCYDFVLGFLCRLKLNDKDASLGSRLKFCEDKLVPKMRQVAKYINLFKEVLQKGSVVQGQISSTSL